MDAFGDASYLLEPHLKEGIGGLRDYHNMLWLARVFFDATVPRDLELMGALSHAEYEDLKKNLRLIWLARCHLHSLSGRENDRILFEYQGQIAQRLGYRDMPDFLAVEHFLGELHPSDCIECGACAYICPSRIPLVQYIKMAKTKELEKK